MNAAMIILLCITSVFAYRTGHVGGTGHAEKVLHAVPSHSAAPAHETPKYHPTHHGGYEKHPVSHVGQDSKHRRETHHSDLHSSKTQHQQHPKEIPHGFATKHHGPAKETHPSHQKTTGYGSYGKTHY
ncbi:histidine-rich protein PFHRP-II-like [Anopheles albimanus]|uniref:Histidine-rich glycoprotein-like n=1 Tax=Anopheles albimanus TaxID=7167 RepID=A0A182FEE5_ANOAL|nr:histidine-rich protein PFHRP-II-like [Anopheles albimanus]